MPKIKVGGIKLHYDVFGKGPTILLFLPGFLGTIEEDFGPLIERLDQEKYTIVSWDPLGFGRSYPPARQLSLHVYENDANLVRKIMEELGYECYHVLGWSGGGQTGLRLAGMFPKRVASLTTFSTISFFRESNMAFYQGFTRVEFWPKEKLDAKLKYLDLEYIKEMSLQIYNYYLQAVRDKWKFPKELADLIQCPMLITHCEPDPYVNVESAHYLASLKPEAKLHIFPQGDHYFHLTNTEEFLKVFLEFLESVA